MLDDIDNMLRQLFTTHIPNLTPPQVGFQPPDDDWRAYVSTLGAGQLALNVYMIELKENRELRSCGRIREVQAGTITETPFPRWVDVYYLITAWGAAPPSAPAVEPTIAEHELLWNVTAALMAADPLTPANIYSPNPPPAGLIPIQKTELPTTILPHEGFGKHAEFWGTMPGQNHPWRPAVLLILTLPVVQAPIAPGVMVTTLITEYKSTLNPTRQEVWAEIGGTVLDGTVPSPFPEVPGASVIITDPSGVQLTSTITDDQGRFRFSSLRFGSYQLQFSATGHAAQARNITVPSPTHEYNLTFT